MRVVVRDEALGHRHGLERDVGLRNELLELIFGLDQMNYAKAFCKESFRIDKIEDIPLAVARAMHIACSGRPGAVYIDFPDDAVAQTMDKDEAAAPAAGWLLFRQS